MSESVTEALAVGLFMSLLFTHIDLELRAVGILNGGIIALNPLVVNELRCASVSRASRTEAASHQGQQDGTYRSDSSFQHRL